MFFAVLLQDTISIPASLSYSESLKLLSKLSLKSSETATTAVDAIATTNIDNTVTKNSTTTTTTATVTATKATNTNNSGGSENNNKTLEPNIGNNGASKMNNAEVVRNLFTELINQKYKNRLIADVGLCLALWDLVSFGDPLIFPNDSATHVEVQFRMLVYRPVVGEVVEATVLHVDVDFGLLASIGFFANLQVPISNLPRPGYFDITKHAWIWQYVDDDEHDGDVADVNDVKAEYEIKTKDKIRMKITHVTFLPDPRTGVPTMSAQAQMKDVGLGPPIWWETDEQEIQDNNDDQQQQQQHKELDNKDIEGDETDEE